MGLIAHVLWTTRYDTIWNMQTITKLIAMEVRLNYVSSSWVAWYYGVPLSNVYAAVNSGRLEAVEVPAAKRNTLLFDRRTLPIEWPSKRKRRRRQLKEAA